jgi:hypothetical protein
MELNHALEEVQNKAVMVCCRSTEEDVEKCKGTQLPGENWNPEHRRTAIYYWY